MPNRYAICLPRSLIAIGAVSLAVLATPAHAQSDSEIASEASAREFYAEVQRRGSAIHSSPSYQFSRDWTLTPEQEAQLAQRDKDDAAVAKLRKDPVFMRYWAGYWDHFQARSDALPGEYCAATYANLNGSITLSAFDGSSNGALLIFIGRGIPKPKQFSEITATLTQDNNPPATVKIYNPPASEVMAGVGTLIFAVPSMAAALSGMEDKQQFVVSVEGEEVFRMSWKEGKKARNALRECTRKR